MAVLRSRGIPALPIHDSLQVPASGAGNVEGAIVSAFAIVAKVNGVRVKMVSMDSRTDETLD